MEGAMPEGWSVVRGVLPAGIAGATDWRTNTVYVDPRYRPVVQRCTLTHELVHVERGPSLAPQYDAPEELVVRKIAARRLIDIRELGEALAESDSLGHVSDVLHVDHDTLMIRLKYLHPAERAYLRRRLEHDEHQHPATDRTEDAAGCCASPGPDCPECGHWDQCS